MARARLQDCRWSFFNAPFNCLVTVHVLPSALGWLVLSACCQAADASNILCIPLLHAQVHQLESQLAMARGFSEEMRVQVRASHPATDLCLTHMHAMRVMRVWHGLRVQVRASCRTRIRNCRKFHFGLKG